MSEVSTADAGGGWGRAVFWPDGARWHGAGWLLVIFCAYAGAVLLFPFLSTDGVAMLWLPNAVLVAALLRFRRRDWPYVYAAGLLAEVVASLTLGIAPQHALYFGAVNVLEATLFVLCAAAIAGGRGEVGLLSVRGASAIVVASVAVPALTGALGAIGSVWSFDATYVAAWQGWWFGDALGLMVGVPLCVLLRDAPRSVARSRSVPLILGAGTIVVALCALSAYLAVTGRVWGAQQIEVGLAVVVALVFGALGAPLAAVLTTTVTLFGLARQVDSFDSVVRDQILIFVVAAAIYAIAAATESGHRAMELARQTMGQLARAQRDLEKANARLAVLVRTDELTGLANRRALSENLELLWAWCVRESKPVSMLMVDLDCFHQYNETYGHVAGDSVIRRVASVIDGCGRRRTDLTVRYGGEEFFVFLPNTSLRPAQQIADRIHKRIRDLDIQHGSSSVAPIVTVSIGLLAKRVPEPGGAAAALEGCDALLYQAKQAGRNRTVTAKI